tara:strand:+ start:854 stop:1174 length:321 start_codon:yes stop_codon:yes gene_type:complete
MVAEANDKAYEAIEIAKKTGKIKKGANEVTKAVERGTAKLVVVAQDIQPKEVIMHLAPLCKEKNITYIEVPSKTDLGTSASLKVSTAAVAIVKEGDSKKLIEELSK